jgi:DMSO reductase anchor subunit
MNGFPKSTYFRILENKQRRVENLPPDYPLIVFMLFSRLSFGLGIVTGVLQSFLDQFRQLLIANAVVSLAALLIAIAASFIHLESPARFVNMIRNSRSKLTWEITLSGLFFIIQAGNILILLLNLTAQWITHAMGCIISILASAAVISTGMVFKFPTHPVWNSKLLPLVYFVSSLIMGASTMLTLTNLFENRLLMEQLSGPILGALGVLFLIQLGITYEYGRENILRQRFHTLATGLSGKLVWLYAGSYFLIPFMCLFASLVQGGIGFLPSAVLATSLFIGVFIERVLFFILEKPSYFFYFANERIKLSN